ncbi:UDP-N-acetylmuramoyl-L-alanine--D-glutamate ligase [Clostridium botulinum]|uniref:UDP-N-acetylmuramoylalanine--D-glutamate ligase n=1 Tax=Clostridium botulinum C/D str. DC5 TaxID=1443128 RepID=A0A0A0I3V0_CLOBO|nr:UDP-N-acetylmuramoyl-L-alanine--D-glutamate ligase [Clostridium botulinum]KEI00748.1 UDP-N-acetylmuramoyl-L-alanyl-D-glutamate synthetase [Clostridium botulinum C/D str. BKT75002]KEI08494.1 UDP-N-acetylmuramoyl-L-alanyl-D-glutamate synthetase [Clostridium botulinum C/D str. BKT2873]KGM96069.1 UDP-N-acetylmuramoyl-L-alanyl-D-glutamate synthetase [Clostridium botulinum C/D str. DC5]KOC54999.1 UDP-N-acetylmuramoyl-L-alanyl-D-glutamate synthetase [Clostridium botulinum]KOC58266.1 UDP-N-acetylmu
MKKNFNEFKEFIKDKQVAVVGIGISNIPLIHFLVKLGAEVTAFDKKDEEKLGDVAVEFKSKGIKLELGEEYLNNLIGFDVVFKTPSMRIDNEALVRAKASGSYITSEMEEFIKYCPAKVFGITGSDGKTTTTTLVYNMLKSEGYKTWVGGNIGNPLFANIEEMTKADKVVLELSSFQLMTIKEDMNCTLVTNLSPNHLDIHKDMEEYVDAKKNIFKYQNENDLLVLNRDNKITNDLVNEAKGRVKQFSIKEEIHNGAYFKNDKLFILDKEVCALEEIKLKGMHNVENLLAAFCLVYEDVSVDSMRKVAITFTGVEHRCEFVRELDGVKYYNDSIASSPTRTVAGLRAFEKPVILIAGGYDKHIPFEPLAEEGYDKIKALILTGVTKEKIKKAFDNVIKNKPYKIPIYMVEGFEEAIYKAKEISKVGDIVTLSPACASFDMFANFEIRGNKFKDIVNNL